MSHNAPDHFSYNFELNLEKIPAKRADRIALNLLLPGMLAAFFLIALGFYELVNGLNPDKETLAIIHPWFNLTVFDLVLIGLGFWIIIMLPMSYFRYKKVFFDGKKITMIYRSPNGAKTTVKEALKKYQGVRLRIEFFQFGFINKNKYIIELYHNDPDKVAPLYISTKDKNIRQRWEYYARKLNLPAIIMTDEGLLAREIKDIGKPLQVLHQEGLIKNDFDFKAPLPNSISWVRKRDKSIIKNRQLKWDGYDLLVWLLIGIGLLFLIINYNAIRHSVPEIIGSVLLLAVMGFAAFKSFTKDKLVIKPKKLVIVHKTFCLSRKNSEIMKDEIEMVDVAFNPLSERYFVSIVGGGKTLIFGKKLPIEDLRWVKRFLINDIIKK